MRQVYFNLHKRGWSVRNPQTGRVENKTVFTPFLILENVTFRVNERGRQRVIREQRKNVHAFSVGTVVTTEPTDRPACVVPVSYNPYKAGHFVRKDTGEPIHQCKTLVMRTKEVDGKRVPEVLAEL